MTGPLLDAHFDVELAREPRAEIEAAHALEHATGVLAFWGGAQATRAEHFAGGAEREPYLRAALRLGGQPLRGFEAGSQRPIAAAAGDAQEARGRPFRRP